ncbi:MAG: hypothetical protein K9J12_08600 [Melioribacteraceae bacterium]|nr:hypothetical protein [Melioribacteraceae bacterium]MCF8264215.1 hypothetical protein [Melioribacteraceae bacterium]
MKKLLFILYIFLASSLFAQMEQVGWIAKFGVAGGFTPSLVMPNLGPLNSQIKNFGLDEISSNGVFSYGGAGYVYVLFVPNLRIGGIGFGGSSLTESNIGGLNRKAEYNYSLAGITLEYTLPFINNMAVSVGAILGSGEVEIDLYQNQGNADWDDVWTDFNAPNNTTNRQLKNNFYTITPTLNIDIPVNRFIAVRVGAGYVMSLSDSWTVDEYWELKNVPDDLNGNSFFLQTGVFIGFFAF